jgi:hypothetical protein
LAKFVVVFTDNILVYSNLYLKHKQHLRQVLQTLRDHQMYAKLSKYEFWMKEVVFLEHIIFAKGIIIDLTKV